MDQGEVMHCIGRYKLYIYKQKSEIKEMALISPFKFFKKELFIQNLNAVLPEMHVRIYNKNIYTVDNSKFI